ncbi:uncharacterized protein LOC114472354 isoform X2 [Gouania willdenowi]|uniref:uncharacterized protein LOC114472354 isoform X2 n=1 Tax=Gouania willdenowi TaxID=441366 RepID=UPI00105669DB|nr:uncharacterized protein LOC114472354 isoform X2 [Gouania willdenowi]
MNSGFWLLWTVLILFSCFCAYRHRRAKLRIQQQQRQREINLIAYNGASNYPSSMLDLSFLASFKLPSYEEVAAQPCTPPPPYSSVFALQGAIASGPSTSYPHHHHHRHPCPPYPPYLGPGPSGLTSSQSSDNYTSCSCESCSLTSPSSTSFSVQVTDETYDSSRLTTPSDTGGGDLAVTFTPESSPLPQSQASLDVVPAITPDVVSGQRCSSKGGERLPPPAPPLSLSVHARPSHSSHLPRFPLILLSSAPQGQALPFSDPLGVVAAAQKMRKETSMHNLTTGSTPSPQMQDAFTHSDSKEEREKYEEEEEDEDEEDHFRHRRLTGDSGIEVCRCHVRRGREEEELQKRGKTGVVQEGECTDALHDNQDCFQRSNTAARSPHAHECREAIITE